MAWALLVEHWIHAFYDHHVATAAAATKETLPHAAAISILWQAPAYILIGWGEIFAVSAAYEVAFTTSAPQTKALASAVNIFCVGGIPNIICIALYQACEKWAFTSTRRGDTNIQHLPDYATARVDRYFYVLLGILLVGMALNLHQHYLQHGTKPVLYKLGSMRAGPSLSHKESKNKAVKKSFIPKLYGGGRQTTGTTNEE